MKIVFFGTPPFAARIFQFLWENQIVMSAVVTQPDRPQGRFLQTGLSAVKEAVQRLAPALRLFQPEKASDPVFLEELASLHADLFVVVAYGKILSRKLLAIPPLGCINLHASLLPKYRGAAPMQRCLMNGDQETGVCVQKMVFDLDAGDVIESVKIPVFDEMNLGELAQKLGEISQPLLLKVLKKYSTGTVPAASPQDSSQVTLAPKIQPEETLIHWNLDADSLHNLVRALSPQPGAWCWIQLNGARKRLKILASKVASQTGKPGELIAFQKETCIVAAGKNSLELLQVQMEGKKRMGVAEWIRGCQNQVPQFPLGRPG